MSMFAAFPSTVRRGLLAVAAGVAVTGLVLLAGGWSLPSAEAQGYAAPAPLAEQPPAKLIVEPPPPEQLAKGVVIVRFRTENAQIVPVFGPAAAAVSPRLGHLHVTLDDATWHWGHTSNDPVIVAPLPPGPHKLLLELADADHKILAQEVVKFEVPRP
jgi:hypothetical protein